MYKEHCMKIEPLGDKVVVERLDPEEVTSGGIVLPESAKEKPQEGKIVAIGTGHRTESGEVIELSVKKGDHIIFSSYAGTEITVEGKEYIVMPEEDILAIVE
jgi:chaperonin GroES